MIMEIKMNNSLTFDEVADKLGCSVEDLQKIALENGLIDENGNPTEMAIREGLFSHYTHCSIPMTPLACRIEGDLSTGTPPVAVSTPLLYSSADAPETTVEAFSEGSDTADRRINI